MSLPRLTPSQALRNLKLSYLRFSKDPVVSRVLVDVQVPGTWSSPGAAPSIHKLDEHVPAAPETTSMGQRSNREVFENYARSPSPPIKLSSAKQIFEKYCADATWPECKDPAFSSSDIHEENMLPGVYAGSGSEPLTDTVPAIRRTQEPHTIRSRRPRLETKLPNYYEGHLSNENTSSNSSKTSPNISQSFHVEMDPKRSPLSSTLRDTHAPPPGINVQTSPELSHAISTLKSPKILSNPRKSQNHLLNYDPTEDDTDSSLASSLKSESDIGDPDILKEDNASILDHQGSLSLHQEPNITSEQKIPKSQGRPRRLSKMSEFHRIQLQGTNEKKSLLHQKLVQSGLKQNPDLLGQYALWGSTDCDNGIKVRLYFPGQVDPTTGQDVVPISLLVRKDANMENLVGFGLLSFFRTYGKYPTHPEMKASSMPRMITDAWNLRIVEDGCVDDDYPSMCYLYLHLAIDPNLNVGQFGEDEFAVCPEPGPCTCYVTHSDFHSTLPKYEPNSDILSGPTADINDQGPLITLNIMVVPSAIGHVQITVPQGASASHVLGNVCQIYHLGMPDLYSLYYRDMVNVIAPHQQVTDFSHTKDLILVERNSLGRQVSLARHADGPLPEQPKYKDAMDLISSYKVSNIDSHSRPIPLIAAIILLWVDTTAL